MRVVTLEEHFSLLLPGSHNTAASSHAAGSVPDVVANAADKMIDIVGDRLADMDRNGITVQVLSKAGVHITPSADQFEGQEAVEFAKKFNDGFARKIAERPDRFAALAHLAASVPDAAADELERTVTEYGFKGTLISGTIRGAFLDDPKFAPLLARAEKLGVPIYIHPGMPPADVRKAYYEGFSKNINFGLSTFAWGWHYEVAVHVMRLAVSGAMDKYPKLNFIMSHGGGFIPYQGARWVHGWEVRPEPKVNIKHSPAPYLDRFIYDTILHAKAPAEWLISQVGANRVLLGSDYPYDMGMMDCVRFVRSLDISEADRAIILGDEAAKILAKKRKVA